ncbi:MAG: hypothetical protein F6K09_04740 [Merismopedia sp. SIO2A8]|nr:hypothetical protein [Symploca sp. SIO2B6]NET48030.1 hypothetical protein [Merismopedia sp. SIO2A8]
MTYPGAAIAHRLNPDTALKFLDFLGTEDAIAVFTEHGFMPVL